MHTRLVAQVNTIPKERMHAYKAYSVGVGAGVEFSFEW